jgi:hypothetical protein
MAITTFDQYIASAKQKIRYTKASRTTVATIPFSTLDLAGQPGARANLTYSNTANGVIQVDTDSGFPPINPFSGGSKGYLSIVSFANSVLSRIQLYDRVWVGGSYAFTAGTTSLSSQPAISGRCPDYAGGVSFGRDMEIWIEVSTAFATGTAWQVQVTYTDNLGNTGHTSIISAAQAAAGLTLGKMFQLALQVGDAGVQKIESAIVTNGGTAMTAGAFNVVLMRPLWETGSIRIANAGDIHGLDKTGMPIVYEDSALFIMVAADATALGQPYILLEVCNG